MAIEQGVNDLRTIRALLEELERDIAQVQWDTSLKRLRMVRNRAALVVERINEALARFQKGEA